MRQVRAGVSALLLAVLSVWFGPALPAYAATITVTTTADEFANPGPGSGCSLREAVQAANTNAAFGGCSAGSGVDTISVPAGAYTLTRTGANEDNNVTGDLDITSNVTVTGAGAGSTTLDGNQTDRLFHVIGSGRSLAISGVTITHGAADFNQGGAIENYGASLTVTDSVLSANSARGGGAIRSWAGTLSVTNSTTSGNTSSSSGGGIELTSGTGALTNVTVTGNSAVLSGGGVRTGGTLTVTSSTISTNTASDGGGLYSSSGNVTISQTVVSGNTASSRGGGIWHDGTNGVLTIGDSTLSGNSSPAGGGIYHGIISSTLTNVTVSGNSSARGGGILQLAGALKLSHSTLVGNSSTTDAGGAVRVQGGSLFSRATVLAQSSAGLNCYIWSGGPLSSQGFNVADDTSCFANGGIGQDRVVGDVGVGPLAANGGPTQTHALQAGSPAIDAVQGSCTSDGGGGTLISTDQRGSPRPSDGDSNGSVLCDAGAYEKQGISPPASPSIASQTTNEDIVTSAIPFTVSDPDTAASSLNVSASSNNQVLIPDASIQLGGSGSNRTIRLTPAANQHGSAIIDVAVSDGTSTTHGTFSLTVNPVNDLPVVANDTYSAIGGRQLVVPVAIGVLANDSDADGTPLGISSHTSPSHGTLSLAANGSFTYTPNPGFTGTDTFTYRVNDGVVESSTATVTINVAAGSCSPRATVRVTTAIVSGKLHATLSVQPLNGGAANRLVELRFGAFQNATVTINGQPIASNATYTVSGNATQVTVVVGRVTPGLATTVPVTAVDECGSWPTFVGGGVGAGF